MFNLKALCVVILIMGSFAGAQTAKTPVNKSQGAVKNQPAPKSAWKHTLLMDYHSWFENLTYRNSSNQEYGLEAVYYGFALSWDMTQYHKEWGWGVQGGLGQGYAVGEGEQNTYREKRVKWTYLRGGGRVFKRLNGRMDLGLALLALNQSLSWPGSSGQVVKGPNPFISLFLEMRWRFNRQWEMVQAMGNSTKNAGANMRIGFGYTF